ncbi:uncharacterized protein LOC119096890 [Pollicipes pollicipes]|uniref:uncharacterized protein LOC119096890 n=1 Tax=Pollicipes pollicipes TaxID=41117 RepID=UPI0018858C3A|nr:uncharacterized protein LOC119096890 [Pollicipes pollicipes]XP_037075775.1 uncharacterized protein LOC119096890 [Pollicipes pollicipes]XP_037075776.1 uncharacterized protein LOC119096890 [Pollicipes pollicipes]
MASARRLQPLPRLSRVRSLSAPLTYSDPAHLADWDWNGWDERPVADGSVPPTAFSFRQRAAEKQRKRSSALDATAAQSLGGQRVAGARSSPLVPRPARPEPDYDDFRRQLSSDREDDYAYAYDCIVSPAEVILSEMDGELPGDGYAYGGRENIYEELDGVARQAAEPPSPGPRYSDPVHSEVERVQRVHSQVLGELRLDMEAMLMPSQRWRHLHVPVGPTDELLSPDSGFQSGSGSGSTVVSNYDTPNGPRTVVVRPPHAPRMRKCESLDLKDALARHKAKAASSAGGEKRLWKLTSVISGLLGKYHQSRSKRRRPVSPL